MPRRRSSGTKRAGAAGNAAAAGAGERLGPEPPRVPQGAAPADVRASAAAPRERRRDRRLAQALRLRAVADAVRRRDWLALAEQLTWTGLAALVGFGAGVVVGLLVTAASMGPVWLGHPVLAAAAAIRRLPVPAAISALAVLGGGFALVRLPAFGRTLLLLARIAVGALAVAVAYRLIVG